MRRLTPLAAVLAALLAAAPATADPVEIGLQDDEVFVSQNLLTPPKGYALATQLGVSRLRVNLGWAGVVGNTAKDRARPVPVPYDWGPVDRAIDQAAANGMRIQLTLMGPVPAWASGRHKVSNILPNPRLFAKFARDVALHFKGRVDRFSIWNEPNYSSWLLPHRTSAQQYRALYQGAYRAIKRTDPTAMVLMGETSPIGFVGRSTSPLEWLRELTCSNPDWTAARSCPPLPLDGYAHHPYTIDFKPYYPGLSVDDATTGSLGRLTNALDKLQQRGALIDTSPAIDFGGTRPTQNKIYLYLTEYGFLARGKRSFPESQRAAYLRKGFQLALRNPRVRLMTQYLLAPQSPIYSFDSSLLDSGGRPDQAFLELSGLAQQAEAAGQVKVPVPFVLPPAPGG
jgi:hypothetical protein